MSKRSGDIRRPACAPASRSEKGVAWGPLVRDWTRTIASCCALLAGLAVIAPLLPTRTGDRLDETGAVSVAVAAAQVPRPRVDPVAAQPMSLVRRGAAGLRAGS